jgi:predicted tellurium resistance membrane protein TerC
VDWITDPNAWIALSTLTLLEIVLGIDNIVFISILASRLPEEEQGRARTAGLALAMLGRIFLLLSLTWVMGLTENLFTVLDRNISGRDLILILGGLFLIYKSTSEIHHKLEGTDEDDAPKTGTASFRKVLIQILILDLVFSLDSVITAVGMAKQIGVMIVAVILAVCVMMLTAGRISAFIEKHPTLKMLALSFLLLIGVNLVAEGLGQHIPKGYIYFAMAFSIFVEALNLRVRTKKKPVHLRETRLHKAIKKSSE